MAGAAVVQVLRARPFRRCCMRLTAALMLATVILACAPADVSAACDLSEGETRTVTRVIDGDTLALDGGSEARLAGALAPRSFDAAGEAEDWPLEAKAREALEALLAARTVEIAFTGRRTDRYGRLLVHAFLPAEPAANDTRPRVWIQGEMLRLGLARAYAVDPQAQCMAELLSQEATARSAGVGLWADAAYAVRPAEAVPSLLRAAGTFQVVEGRVRVAGNARTMTYLNFGEDFRQDFTILLRPAIKRALAANGTSPENLQGAVIRVRGWIERRGGPMIDLTHPALIELIEPARAAEPEAAATQLRRHSARRSPPSVD